MLGNKNTKKKTIMGGVGIALLLCALMVGMTMTNFVQNEAPQVENEKAVANEDSNDFLALPDVYEPAQYEYDETSELEGMRSMNQKAFLTEDGKTALLTAAEPVHYMSSTGSWEEIDLNIKATLDGWEVKESIYEVSFASEIANGVSVMVHPNVDPIVTGLNPVVTTVDESGKMAQPYMTTPSQNGVSVGGNVIRYPIAEGFDLDYTVGEVELKQNLVVRDRPVLDESVAFFGLTEQMRLPAGYGLFLGNDVIREEITQTQDELAIRNLETGDLLATIPVPVVIEMDAEEPYHATYFVQVFGNTVFLTTAVDTDWLMDEDRQFPLAIDPSISVTRNAGGYCYIYYGYCYSSSYSYLRHSGSRIYYMPWHKYTFTSANALPTGATIDSIDWKQYVRYGYTYGSSTITATVMEKCGTASTYSWTVASATCSSQALTTLTTGYGTTAALQMISSMGNSASAGTYSTGTGWKTANLCSSSGTACSSSTGSHNYVVSAINNGGSIGMSAKYPVGSTIYYYSYNTGSTMSYMQVTYSGGSDTTPPTDGFVPYTGITSYKAGERTFFTNLQDNGGIDTTSSGAPHLHYSINNGSYTAVKATSIGTCGSGATECSFRASTGSISTGDYVNYFWAYRDLASTPNLGTSPSGGSGTPSTASAPASPYWFFVDDAANAGDDKKMTVSLTDTRAYTSTSASPNFDRQMTYYEDSEEYVFEFDTSACGTGSSSCFYTSSYYFYSQWKVKWTSTVPSGYNGMGGTVVDTTNLNSVDSPSGYLTMSADDGPGMNLIFLYDSTKKQWAMVGLGTDTGIEEPLTSGTSPGVRSTYGYTKAYLVDIPGDITGTFGEFEWNATYSTSKSNWMCVGSNGWFYFFRSTSSNPTCTSSYYYIYSASYRWSGFSLGGGYYSPIASTGGVLYKVAKVAPEPDTTAPLVDHSAMRDSHSRDRTFTFGITDGGEPPTGINTSTTVGVGPTLYYRITDADGTVNNWQSTLLSPSGQRSACATVKCDWSADLEDLERGSSVEYYITVKDTSTATSGTNTNTTSTNSFEVGDPNKMFVVEWHDMGYTSTYQCTYQVIMYDVTNEIEFHYDSGCQATYDYATVGYQDQTRTKGATVRTSAGYINGANPHSANYRISTGSSGHAWETFDMGLTELPTYDTAISGASNGQPYGYYCVSNYYWNQYKSGCSANIDLPDDFVFDYFGKEYNGSDSKNRVHIGRMGNMYLKDDGSTALERSITSWYSNMPNLPYSSSSYSKPGNIAPWWGYYSSYYCYDTTNIDCSVRTRVIPFEGKGTDISADITQPTTWSKIDSPIRVNPSSASGYLSIGADLTIEAGTVIQVAPGKGLSFDGTCSEFTAEGNATDPVLFEGQQQATWKGLAFTAACSSGTDDRHEMSYVDFKNTSDAAIVAGSRHGNSPSSNANVGNFTMDHVTFTNVGTAFKHGSGQGTVLTMSDFEINDASDACFDLAEDSVVTLRDGEMNDCNSNGNSWGGAVINYPGSTAGELIMENIDIDDSMVNLVDVDFATVWMSNVTATTTSAQVGTVLGAAGAGTGSSTYVFNMEADGYADATINSLDSVELRDVDWGSADVSIVPGGSSSTAAGPSGDNAVISNFESDDLTMTRIAPTMDDITIGQLSILGNSPSNIGILGSNWDTDGISVSGCGYKVVIDNVTTDYVAGSCSNSAAPNTIMLSDVTATYTGTMNALYARNSGITIGEGSVTMPSSYDKMAKASTNGRIILIDVNQIDSSGNSSDCESAADCDVSSSSSGAIYFGGLATVKVYKLLPSGKDYKEGHTVQATAVDAGSPMFMVGTHKTDVNGEASVWVLTANDAGDTYSDHNLVAFGPSGQNETMVTDSWYPGSFEVGDTIELRLEPAPVTLNGTNMDCAYLLTNPDAILGYDGSLASGGTNTYTWEGKVTMTGDLNVDDCNIIMRSVFRVSSDATSSPKLTISDGGSLTFESTATDTGTLKASSSTYPLLLDIDGGNLALDGGVIMDVLGGINLDSGIMTVSNSAMIYGNSGAAADEATLHVNGGVLDWDDSTIMNSGQTGIGLMVEQSATADVDNIVVKNAAIGMHMLNSAPTVDGFTLTDNDVGIDVEGSMSLPTIYRSPRLSGESTGWKTYAIDLTTYMGDSDYLQVGWNAVYAGGNAHPTYNYATSKYYMITDNLNVELTDTDGNSWNVTNSAMTGYYQYPASYNCNTYGYSYGPVGWGYTYREPAGFDWVATDNTPSGNYPIQYWSQYSPSWMYSGVYTPPQGLTGYYNVCVAYAYSYYTSPGDDARLTFPIVDVSDPSIASAKLYVDVLHNRADNYQDRLEIVARAGDDVTDLGSFARESGVPTISSGTITGADNGIEVGGNFAAVELDDITVTSPVTSGLEITGSAAATVTDLTVTGGTYGVLAGAGASGTVDLSNVDIDGTSSSGVYYIKNMNGELSGTIANSAGSAIKFGSATTNDITYSNMNLATNAIGIETAGSGTLDIVDSTFGNSMDVLITGSSNVNFIEGSVDTASVSVTGNGLFSRMRTVDINVVADTNAVSGANVILKNAQGEMTGSSITDTSGDALDMRFVTTKIDSAGTTTLSLAGYEAVTVSKVGTYSYSNPSTNSGDFRYSFDNLSLSDSPGNTHSMDLTDSVDARICYSYTSSSYNNLDRCAGFLSTSGQRTYSSGLVEYGYYGATPQSFQNKVVMVDTGIWYIDGDTDNTFDGSTFLVTGARNSDDAMQLWSTSPYGARMKAHNTEWVSLAVDDGDAQGIKIGYNGWNDVVPDIQNSTISGLATIVTTFGPKYTWRNSPWEADFFNIQNNTLTAFHNPGDIGSQELQYHCLNAGGNNTTIMNNVIKNCGVGVSLRRTGFTYYHSQSFWGADDAVIENNEFIDMGRHGVWFTLNSYTEGVEIRNNEFTGSTMPTYSVYAQDRTATDMLVEGNTFDNAQRAVYLRGALDWDIRENTITGDGDSSNAGIYVLNGYGEIDGNTLVDADGGILVDGIQFGYNANVTNNDISQSAGRNAPAAVGIWAEDCGSSVINTGGNTISTMENSIVTDGCDLVDESSTLTARGGAGGAVYTVRMLSDVFSPSSLTISTGDTVRWRSVEYWNNTNSGHNVQSNDTDAGGSPLWSSGSSQSIMNIGSTYLKTFNTAGTYEYHCGIHTWMYGSITVSNSTSSGFASVGVNVVGTTDEITLDGTSVSGYGTAIEQFGGSMTLMGDALLSGGEYAAYAEDTDVVVDGASLIADSTGSAMYVTGTSSFDATDMDTSGQYGLNIDAVDFRWNGGDSDATTSLLADGGAEGSVENVTWADSTTQIHAGSYTTVTSVGNTVDASKLIIDATAVVHEGNLLDLDVTHKAGSATDIGLLIQSTDGAQAAYVSPAYRAPFMTADGDLDEWYGNVKNPSDDAMPGVMSSDDAGEDFLATWDANNLYLALTGVDMGSADLQIYIDSSTGGDTTGDSWYVSHSLPFAADYVFWAEDGSTSQNSGLKVNGFTGWSDVTNSCSGLSSYIGHSSDTDTEIAIPWNCIGEPSSTVRMIVIVQDESTGAIQSVHPDQTVATGSVGQTFTDELTLLMGHGDLAEGDDLRNHLLIYRSYVGSNTPSDAKTYDISVKVDAPCAEDWGTITSVDMSTNVAESIDIKRACPVIQNLVDITVNEDSGAYTLTLTDKADDVQDEENTLTWTVADDTDPSLSPTMLLDSGLSTQTMTITPDNDQFGSYVFHFGVEDSHGLTDSATITFNVLNVNDAPVICNAERTDCMPVFADDGDGNLNVLDEGFGSVSKVLGSAANATGSYVIDMASNDMANEQPQVYTWGASIKAEDVTVEPYWVQKKYNSVAAMFADAGDAVTALGGLQDIAMSGDPSSISPNGTYVLPTLNDVGLLTYLLAQNGCGSVWYQEYMDSSGNKVTAVRSDDGCDSTIDANAKVYQSLNYTLFWQEAYGIDVTSFDTTWEEIFPNGYTTTGGYDPCPAFTVTVVNNELTITENAVNELGGECTIVLTLKDDGGYCQNTYLGRTADVRAACVGYTWLIDYPYQVAPGVTVAVTGCYNLYTHRLIPPFLADGTPTGYTEDVCLGYEWLAENVDAQNFEVNFSVTPVNDAPEVLEWDRQAGVVISDGNGDVPNFPWKITLTEDDQNVDNLTYDLSAMKDDNDHEDNDLVWTIVKTDTCNYEDYFAATINGDDISFDLIKDATTNAPEWEVDYLNNGGIHQKNPLSGEFCPITLELHDTATAPSYIPNYDMPTANYQQGEDSVTLYVRVDNVAENVPDYYLDSELGFNYNEVTNIMPKTFVPTTVTIGHGGDEGPYNYDHMLEVTFHSNGYNSDDPTGDEYVTLGTQYVVPPAYGETLEVTDFVYITSTSNKIWVEVDVLTCVDDACDMTATPEDRFFGYAFPHAHACIDSNGEQGEAWSCPGESGSSSVDEDGNPSAITLENKRRPMLEDQDWCNNLMSTNDNGTDCAQPRTFGKTTEASGQNLPTVVRLIGTADVPSFAPTIIAISAAGLFVSALVLQSRREEEEQSLEEMTLDSDEQAVSPVIATILMVAITVVLSGVIYVWASSLADTSAKGVPRMTFDVDSSAITDGNDAFHRITVTGSQVELATQAIVVTMEYSDVNGDTISNKYNLADTTVYGFYPGNSDSLVTFTDAVGSEGGAVKSSFDTGDTIYISAVDEDGNVLSNIYVSISYVPPSGSGSVLRTWSSL